MQKLIITPEAVRPHPRTGPRKKSQASSASAPQKRGDTNILTDTPVKLQLEDELRNREQKKLKMESNKTVKTKLAVGLPSATRKLKQRKPKSRKTKASDDTEECKLYQFQFGNAYDPKRCEDWLKCLVCCKWFHDSCAQANGILDIGDKFTCIDCIP